MNRTRPAVHCAWRASCWLLPRAWLVVPLGLVVYSLTEPWARARIVLFWGISRSPGALMLVLLSSLGMLVAGVAVAGRRSLRLAAFVHLLSGALMCGVSWRAYEMVQDAGVKALGLIPIASVRPGDGLRAFFVAAIVVLAVGMGELTVVLARGHRARRSGSPPKCGAPAGDGAASSVHVRA